MELTFRENAVAILERTEGGVSLSRRMATSFESSTWSGSPDQHSTLQDVLMFFWKEEQLPYSFISKNCKHFGYDFFTEVMHKRHIGEFGDWCRKHEDVWRIQT
jgi:hypothetical protein